MKIARPLLLLLAFGLTHKTYASQREQAAKKALESLAAAEAVRCLQKDQGNREICHRPAIQMKMAKEKEKAEELKAQVDPKAGMLMKISEQEAAAERDAGRAYVGSSVVVLHNRNEFFVSQAAGHARGPQRGVSDGRNIDVTKSLAGVLSNHSLRPTDRYGATSIPPHRARL